MITACLTVNRWDAKLLASHPLSLPCPFPPAPLLFEWGVERLSGLKISWRNVSVYSSCCPICRSVPSCGSGHLWIDLLRGDHGTVWSIQRHHQGLLTALAGDGRSAGARLPFPSLSLSPSKTHLVPFSFSILLHFFFFSRAGRPPHSAVLEIKGISMSVRHADSQSWLNSLTTRQT